MAGMKQSYYSLVHPQTDWTAFEKERADAMYYDESRLRECVKTLMDELACKTGNEDGSSFRSAVKWDDRRDCFSFLEIKISLAEKQRTQIGLAHIDEDYCVKCGLCVRKCPRQAITKEKGAFPIVHADICIGCGACQVACSVEAIKIMAVDRQQILK